MLSLNPIDFNCLLPNNIPKPVLRIYYSMKDYQWYYRVSFKDLELTPAHTTNQQPHHHPNSESAHE